MTPGAFYESIQDTPSAVAKSRVAAG
jgi:hypothetical protein